ncbi:MAG: hypothetical protein M1531_11115 [Chloroflexi bacterium]|nr:hypothetical protein [Chloroflexota bacterium]
MSNNSKRILVLMVSMTVIAVPIIMLLAQPAPGVAMPDYAAATGQACGTCHISPGGGGPLTDAGNAFAAIDSHASDPAGAWAQVSGVSAPAPADVSAPAADQPPADQAPADDAPADEAPESSDAQ